MSAEVTQIVVEVVATGGTVQATQVVVEVVCGPSAAPAGSQFARAYFVGL